jgi:hypothetical protein
MVRGVRVRAFFSQKSWLLKHAPEPAVSALANYTCSLISYHKSAFNATPKVKNDKKSYAGRVGIKKVPLIAIVLNSYFSG